jgi:iron complex transport system substrate-binding protein
MLRLILITSLLLAAVETSAAAERVASIGLCADQAVTALLDEDRIAALSPQARDPKLSVVAKAAERLPTIAPSAEAVLTTGADVVAANYYGDFKTIAMLERLGVKVVRVPSAETFDDVAAALIDVGDKLAAAGRARALTDDIAVRRQVLQASSPETPVLAAYYRPDGGSAGSGTFVSGAMAAAGLESLSTRLGRKGWGRLDMETLVMNRPQAFVVSYFDQDAYSARRAFGRHPVLRRLMAEIPVINVPGRLWSCGGWPLIEAAELMSHQRLEKNIR